MVLDKMADVAVGEGENSILSSGHTRRHPKKIHVPPRKNQNLLAEELFSGKVVEPINIVSESIPRWLENCEASNVPEEVLDHIKQSPELILNSLKIEGLGLGGKTPEVREMVVSDHAANNARGPAEISQGLTDYGHLTEKDPGWKQPSIAKVDSDGNEAIFDGEISFKDSKTILARNHGSTRLSSLTEIGGDKESFNQLSNGKKAHGMWGRGWKIALTTMVSTPSDRREVAGLFIDEARFANNNVENIIRYRDSAPEKPEKQSYAYVQAKDPDTGKYFRAYAYRYPSASNGRKLWTLKYAVFELDETKIAESDKEMVITAHVNPDREQCKVWDDLVWNDLNCNPYYPSAHNLTRHEGDTRPQATIEHYENKNFNKTLEKNNGKWSAEEIAWPAGISIPEQYRDGIYVEGLRLQVRSRNWEGRTLMTWNISTNQDEVMHNQIHRENDSVHVSGDPEEIVYDCISMWVDKERWKKILEPNIGESSMDNTRQPFMEERVLGNWKSTASTEVQSSIKQAFLELAPNSAGHYYQNESYHSLWKQLNPSVDFSPTLVSNELAPVLPSSLIDCDKLIRDVVVKDRNISKATYEKIEIEVINQDLAINKNNNKKDSQALNELLNLPNINLKKNVLYYNRETSNSAVIGLKRNSIGSIEDIGSMDSETTDIFKQKLIEFVERGFVVEIYIDRFRTADVLTLTKSNDINILVRGRQNHNPKFDIPEGGVVVSISSPNSVEKMNDLVRDMDEYFTGINPTLIKHDEKTLTLIQEQLNYLQSQVNKSQSELEKIQKSLLGTLANKEKKQVSLEGLMKSGHRVRKMGGLMGSDAILPDQIMASTFDHEEIMESFFEKPDWEPMSEMPDRIQRIDYTISTVGDIKIPSFIPTYTANNLRISNQAIIGSAKSNHWDFVDSPLGESMWKVHGSGDNALANHVREGQRDYDAILITSRELRLPEGDNVIVAVPKGWEITHISLPEDSKVSKDLIDGKINVPLIFRDQITRHTVIQSRSKNRKSGADMLPKGTRIYVRPISSEEGGTAEENIKKIDNNYYESLSSPLINVKKLDPQTQRFVYLCNSLTLSREQKVQAVREYWEGRRLYDDSTHIESFEQIVMDGKGVCSRAALGALALLRAVGVPSQITTAYVYENGGTLDPPFHVIVEFLNDAGEWGIEDPPNRKMTHSFANMLEYQLANSNMPLLHDAKSLGHTSQSEQVSQHPQVQSFLTSMDRNMGTSFPEKLTNLLTVANTSKTYERVDLALEMLEVLADSKSVENQNNLSSPPESKNLEKDSFLPIGEAIYMEYKRFITHQRKARGREDTILEGGVAKLFAQKLANLFGASITQNQLNQYDYSPLTASNHDARIDKAVGFIAHTEGSLAALSFLWKVMTQPKDVKILTTAAALLQEKHVNMTKEQRMALASLRIDLNLEED
ncbi:hypothetical protein KBD75_02880 [Candidatus Woesebacteria bacterium]|nr:hypothetical protein [Candidatus Woesebacteria bacterium]